MGNEGSPLEDRVLLLMPTARTPTRGGGAPPRRPSPSWRCRTRPRSRRRSGGARPPWSSSPKPSTGRRHRDLRRGRAAGALVGPADRALLRQPSPAGLAVARVARERGARRAARPGRDPRRRGEGRRPHPPAAVRGAGPHAPARTRGRRARRVPRDARPRARNPLGAILLALPSSARPPTSARADHRAAGAPARAAGGRSARGLPRHARADHARREVVDLNEIVGEAVAGSRRRRGSRGWTSPCRSGASASPSTRIRSGSSRSSRTSSRTRSSTRPPAAGSRSSWRAQREGLDPRLRRRHRYPRRDDLPHLRAVHAGGDHHRSRPGRPRPRPRAREAARGPARRRGRGEEPRPRPGERVRGDPAHRRGRRERRAGAAAAGAALRQAAGPRRRGQRGQPRRAGSSSSTSATRWTRWRTACAASRALSPIAPT